MRHTNTVKMIWCVLLIAVGGSIQAYGATKSTAHEGVQYIIAGLLLWVGCGILVAIDHYKSG
ncbi:MAG TPA: hypothetical protein VEP90_20085 [Methylomirabilota bacterium]|nr:hypothetical protein [Methylomirabilota bacterium]